MNLLHRAVFVTSAISLLFLNASCDDGIYKKELLALKENKAYAGIFNENIPAEMNAIQRDIENYAHVPFLQRLVLFIFLMSDALVVTPETMPALYAYVDGICKSQNMKMPVVFISRKESVFKAFASKLLLSCGGILIGQKIIVESSDAAVEGVIAHELGHIKYNHVNKHLMLQLLVHYCMPKKIFYDFFGKYTYQPISSVPIGLGLAPLFRNMTESLVVAAIINKRFEKEADEFAYKVNGKGDGLVEFFELLDKRDAVYEQGFLDTHEILQASQDRVGFINYLRLARRYYTERTLNYLWRAYKWLYHNTFMGAHPSHEARIAAVRAYQQSEEAKTA